MKKTILKLAFAALTTVGLPLPSVRAAGGYGMSWTVVAGGGSGAAAAAFALHGTVGQPAAGPALGGNCSVAAGFWATEYAVVQVTGVRLTLTRSGPNVVLSWPVSAAGYTLQSTGELKVRATWGAVSQAVVVVGSQNTVAVPATQARQFFRLAHP